MNRKQQNTLEAIFEESVRANIAWKDIEALFLLLFLGIEDYLDFCATRNEEPERPFLGNSACELTLICIAEFPFKPD